MWDNQFCCHCFLHTLLRVEVFISRAKRVSDRMNYTEDRSSLEDTSVMRLGNLSGYEKQCGLCSDHKG
ncbi:hypothetical protein HBA_0937 [Sodalis endosymbiont of Henestaris halophilus]|nr:hypothetical protein HBA_0937 [Sodalis endosymbiont of Henestaris halophilus]